MHRNKKTENHKALRQLWNEYTKFSEARFSSGEWVDVEPYQRGWVRSFMLRSDAKNRTDAREMQQVLDMINTEVHSRDGKFLTKNIKTGQLVPVGQRLKWLKLPQYEALSEKHKSYFGLSRWHEPAWKHDKVEYVMVEGWVFIDDFYFIFRTEPNFVVQHWIPNQQVESRYGELKTHMQRNNIWAKLNKPMHWQSYRNHWTTEEQAKYRNADGVEMYDESTD